MPDDHRADRELSRFWNELLAGGGSDPAALDPEIAAIVRRVHALASAPLPRAARERVWRGLMTPTHPTANHNERTMTRPADLFGTDGQNDWLRLQLASPDGHALPGWRGVWVRPLVRIALALLLLVGIVGGWLVLGAPLPGTGGDHPAGIPAPLNTPVATPDPASYEGVLVDAMLMDQPLTSQYIDIERLTFGAGAGVAENDSSNSNFVVLITEGELTVTVNGPTQVFKGLGAVAQPGAAGVPQRLVAGDALGWGPGTHFKIEHDGNAPAVLVSFNVLDPTINNPSLMNVSLYQVTQANGRFAPGPLRLIVRRVSLAPGETYRTPTAGPLVLVGPEDPSEAVSGYINGDATNTGDRPANLLVTTIEPLKGTGATPVGAG